MDRSRTSYLPLITGALLLACLAGTAAAAVVDPELEAELKKRAPQEEVAVIVSLADKVNLKLFKLNKGRTKVDPTLIKALRTRAATTQAPIKQFLQNKGGKNLKELWAVNGIAVKLRADAVKALASQAGIDRIKLDAILQAPAVTLGTPVAAEWNLSTVQAPDLWALGHTGIGVVVASLDTGVDVNHPDLAPKYRGGANSWFDPHGEHLAPYDMNGHGTQTTGIMVGGAAGGTAIGVAPDARWIAVKLFNDAGFATYSDIHLAFQWLLDPDSDPTTADAPDVVNASWGLGGATGQCVTEFNLDIEQLKAAGIAVVFAAGNDGPAPMTDVSPANNPAGYSAGAVDNTLTIAGFSSRGQSACDGTTYPELVAPGVNVNTSDLSFGGMPLYATVSGTSYAAPHTAGVMALLAGAFPTNTVADIEGALTLGAQDLGVAGPDNSYGNGLTQAKAAYDRLAAQNNRPPMAAGDSYAMIAGGTLSRAAPGVLANDSDPEAKPLTAVLDTPSAQGSATLNPDGSFSFTPAAGFTGNASFAYTAQDDFGTASTPATVSIAVTANRAPATLDDTATAPVRGTATYPAVILNVLANDADPDTAIDPANVVNPATVFLTTAPDNGGTASANADGTIAYRPKAGFSGVETFRYKVRDSLGLASNPGAFVRVTVSASNAPPTAVAETYTTPQGTPLTVAAPGVLANDSDPDGNPITAVLVTPSPDGTVTLNPDGSFSFAPAAAFTGTTNFSYQAVDNQGAASAPTAATVTVNVAAPANQPPTATADTYAIPQDTLLTVAAPGVLANDSDPDGNPLTAVLVTPSPDGTVTLNLDGSFSFAPAAAFTGTTSFSYQAVDSQGAASAPTAATVTVNVAAPAGNQAPVVMDDTATAPARTSKTYKRAIINVLANDSDPDTATDPANAIDPATVSLTTVPNQGGSAIIQADGSIAYRPALNFRGTESFRYKVSDTLGLKSPTGALVQISVQ